MYPWSSPSKINLVSGKRYIYTAKAESPQTGDKLYYLFDWGDGTDSGWLGPYSQTKTVEAYHIWNEIGNYEIKARVKDEIGFCSGWSDPLDITVAKSKNIETYKNIKNFLLNLFDFNYLKKAIMI